MKRRKTLFTVCIVLAILFVCGCSSGGEAGVEPAKVTVTYDTKGQSFEIIKDLSAYTDSSLSNKLKLDSCTVNGAMCVYTFLGESEDEIEQLYIKLPVLYQSAKVSGVSSSAAKGSLCKDENGEDWFKVTETWAGISADGIELDMTIEPYTASIPRTIELIVDNTAYSSGSTGMGFDETGELTEGEIKFNLPGNVMTSLLEGEVTTGGEVTLSGNVTIRVSEVLKRIEADETAFTSDVEEMIIVN